jgi:hypothetical protein
VSSWAMVPSERSVIPPSVVAFLADARPFSRSNIS